MRQCWGSVLMFIAVPGAVHRVDEPGKAAVVRTLRSDNAGLARRGGDGPRLGAVLRELAGVICFAGCDTARSTTMASASWCETAVRGVTA